MRHATRLQDVHAAITLAAELDIAQQQPGIDERRNARLALFLYTATVREAGEHRGNLTRLQEIDQPHHHGLGLGLRAGFQKIGDRVDDHHVRLEFLHQFVER